MKNSEVVLKVETELKSLGLSNLEVSLVKDEGGIYINTRWEKTGAFGSHSDKLGKYFSLEMYVDYFRNRSKWLALSSEERAKITIHPQVYQNLH